MILKDNVRDIVLEYIKDTDYQLIDLTIGNDNRIVVEVDNYDGVDVDFCAKLTRHIENNLNRDIEDYELEVGSSGLTSPFKTLMQYQKNVGNNIEVLTRDGRKLFGQLVEAEPEHFSIDIEQKVKVEGKKRKETQIQTLTFGYDEVKYARYDLKI